MRYHVITACGDMGYSHSYRTLEEAEANREAYLAACDDDYCYYDIEECDETIFYDCFICKDAVELPRFGGQ